MAEIGKFNTLAVVKQVEFGIYLDGGELGEILLPRRYVPEGARVGDKLEVFLYLDSDDRLIATTEKPLAQVGEFAFLQVASVTPIGAFLNWGLPKDLLVPFREQLTPMREGKGYCVHVHLDPASRRIVASTKLNKHLSKKPTGFREGQEVGLLVCERTDLGYKTIVENAAWGTLYKNEVFRELEPGQRLVGYIRKVRDDGKLDIRLQKPGFGEIADLSAAILARLEAAGGFLEVTDHSPPEAIAALFGVSKKAFKIAVGALYKKRMITLDDFGITLAAKKPPPR